MRGKKTKNKFQSRERTNKTTKTKDGPLLSTECITSASSVSIFYIGATREASRRVFPVKSETADARRHDATLLDLSDFSSCHSLLLHSVTPDRHNSTKTKQNDTENRMEFVGMVLSLAGSQTQSNNVAPKTT